VRYVRYAADGWGVGELVLDGDVLVHHEGPRQEVGKVAVPGTVPGRGEAPLAHRMRAYFGGVRDDFLDVEIDVDGATPFQRAVCDALRRVPYGETVTYGELAALAGYPNAYRAAGTFCATNRFSIVVPCHRVVGADGSLTGYGGGLQRKRQLLDLECDVLF